MEYLKLIGGLILLIISGDFLVKGSVAIAEKFKITPLVIGLTVVAFGTSAPELIVSLQAAIRNSPEIALGNVIGSNIANIGLILGITAIISPLRVSSDSIRIDWPVMMGAALLFILCSSFGWITRIEGLIGFALLICYSVWQIKKARRQDPVETPETIAATEPKKKISLGLAILCIIGSAFGLAYGADFMIDGATVIALSFGISERIIGVTIVAFGTSLPELATSVSAALKKQADIAIGNVIGSNIFNVLCVIGMTAVIKPIPVDWHAFRYDFIIMAIFSVLLILLIFPFRSFCQNLCQKKLISGNQLISDGRLARIGGMTLLIAYIYYIYTLFN